MTNSTTNAASNQHLEQCPFCGEVPAMQSHTQEDEMGDGRYVFLVECGNGKCPMGLVSTGGPYRSQADAAKRWNTRSRVSDGRVVATDRIIEIVAATVQSSLWNANGYHQALTDTLNKLREMRSGVSIEDELRRLLASWTQPCESRCDHGQCILLHELYALQTKAVLDRARLTVKPIVDREKQGEVIGDLMNMRLDAATASPAGPKEEVLVDEVQHRMDQVVDAAVEWHQTGRIGGEWMDAAERLTKAIDSLLELRDDPQTASMPRRHCSVHSREEFKYESLEHELRATTPSPDAAREAAEALYHDLHGRQGFDLELDDDVELELLSDWTGIIRSHCFPSGGESRKN